MKPILLKDLQHQLRVFLGKKPGKPMAFKDLAAAAKVTSSTLCRIEQGGTRPSDEFVRRVFEPFPAFVPVAAAIRARDLQYGTEEEWEARRKLARERGRAIEDIQIEYEQGRLRQALAESGESEQGGGVEAAPALARSGGVVLPSVPRAGNGAAAADAASTGTGTRRRKLAASRSPGGRTRREPEERPAAPAERARSAPPAMAATGAAPDRRPRTRRDEPAEQPAGRRLEVVPPGSPTETPTPVQGMRSVPDERAGRVDVKTVLADSTTSLQRLSVSLPQVAAPRFIAAGIIVADRVSRLFGLAEGFASLDQHATVRSALVDLYEAAQGHPPASFTLDSDLRDRLERHVRFDPIRGPVYEELAAVVPAMLWERPADDVAGQALRDVLLRAVSLGIAGR